MNTKLIFALGLAAFAYIVPKDENLKVGNNVPIKQKMSIVGGIVRKDTKKVAVNFGYFVGYFVSPKNGLKIYFDMVKGFWLVPSQNKVFYFRPTIEGDGSVILKYEAPEGGGEPFDDDIIKKTKDGFTLTPTTQPNTVNIFKKIK